MFENSQPQLFGSFHMPANKPPHLNSHAIQQALYLTGQQESLGSWRFFGQK